MPSQQTNTAQWTSSIFFFKVGLVQAVLIPSPTLTYILLETFAWTVCLLFGFHSFLKVGPLTPCLRLTTHDLCLEGCPHHYLYVPAFGAILNHAKSMQIMVPKPCFLGINVFHMYAFEDPPFPAPSPCPEYAPDRVSGLIEPHSGHEWSVIHT